MKIPEKLEEYKSSKRYNDETLEYIEELFKTLKNPEYVYKAAVYSSTITLFKEMGAAMQSLPNEVLDCIPYGASTASINAAAEIYANTHDVEKANVVCGEYSTRVVDILKEAVGTIDLDLVKTMTNTKYNSDTTAFMYEAYKAGISKDIVIAIADKHVQGNMNATINVLKEWKNDKTIPDNVYIDIVNKAKLTFSPYATNIEKAAQAYKNFTDKRHFYDLLAEVSGDTMLLISNYDAELNEAQRDRLVLFFAHNQMTSEIVVKAAAMAIKANCASCDLLPFINFARNVIDMDYIEKMLDILKNKTYKKEDIDILYLYTDARSKDNTAAAFDEMVYAYSNNIMGEELKSMLSYESRFNGQYSFLSKAPIGFVKDIVDLKLSKNKNFNKYLKIYCDLMKNNYEHSHQARYTYSDLTNIARLLVNGYEKGYSESQMNFCRNKSFAPKQIEQIYEGFDTGLKLVQIKKYAKVKYSPTQMEIIKLGIIRGYDEKTFNAIDAMSGLVKLYYNDEPKEVLAALKMNIPPIIIELAYAAGTKLSDYSKRLDVLHLILDTDLSDDILNMTAVFPITTVAEAQIVLNSAFAKYNSLNTVTPASDIIFNFDEDIDISDPKNFTTCKKEDCIISQSSEKAKNESLFNIDDLDI